MSTSSPAERRTPAPATGLRVPPGTPPATGPRVPPGTAPTTGPHLPHGAAPPVALRETCRLAFRTVPLWPYHRARLASGGCGSQVLEAADAAVAHAAAQWAGPESSRLRLTVVVGTDGAVTARVQRRLSSLDVPYGPVVVPIEVQAANALPPGAAKPADRSWWDTAQSRARSAGGDQALLVLGGRILDGGTATLWLAKGGGLLTPPAPDAIAGVARAFILDRCEGDGVRVCIGPLSLADLEAADEVFLSNAFGGVVPVRGRGGHLHARVRGWFDEVWGQRR